MTEDVEALVLLGLERAEAEQAVASQRVPLALVDQLLGQRQVYSTAEAASASGVPASYLRARDKALGVGPGIGYDQTEIADLVALAELLELVGPASVLRLLRTDATSLRAVAMSSLQLAREELADPIRDAGGNDLAVAVTLGEAARQLLPLGARLIGADYRRILGHLLTTELVAAASRHDRAEVEIAVGFVDVVGYTSLAARIDPRGLDEVLEAFELRCYTAAAQRHDVQLVKFLGDAAMYVSVAPEHLAGVLLDIVASPIDDDSPLAGEVMRAGMAFGEVLTRGGDYFGPPVNLAARLTDRARPGTLLADDGLAQTLESFATRKVPPLRLRGVGVRRPLRVRPAD